VKKDFVPVDVVRWEQFNVTIDGIKDAVDLLNQIGMTIDDYMKNEVDNRHLVYRITLLGRGPMYKWMAQPNRSQEIWEELNRDKLSARRFALCGEILNQTGSEHDRDALRQGQDFIGDFLRLTEKALQDEDLLTNLHEKLEPLYGDQRVRKYREELRYPTTDELQALLEKAEDTALDLLVDDEAEG
jgi:hypothetical protein